MKIFDTETALAGATLKAGQYVETYHKALDTDRLGARFFIEPATYNADLQNGDVELVDGKVAVKLMTFGQEANEITVLELVQEGLTALDLPVEFNAPMGLKTDTITLKDAVRLVLPLLSNTRVGGELNLERVAPLINFKEYDTADVNTQSLLEHYQFVLDNGNFSLRDELSGNSFHPIKYNKNFPFERRLSTDDQVVATEKYVADALIGIGQVLPTPDTIAKRDAQGDINALGFKLNGENLLEVGGYDSLVSGYFSEGRYYGGYSNLPVGGSVGTNADMSIKGISSKIASGAPGQYLGKLAGKIDFTNLGYTPAYGQNTAYKYTQVARAFYVTVPIADIWAGLNDWEFLDGKAVRVTATPFVEDACPQNSLNRYAPLATVTRLLPPATPNIPGSFPPSPAGIILAQYGDIDTEVVFVVNGHPDYWISGFSFEIEGIIVEV